MDPPSAVKGVFSGLENAGRWVLPRPWTMYTQLVNEHGFSLVTAEKFRIHIVQKGREGREERREERQIGRERKKRRYRRREKTERSERERRERLIGR